LLVSIIFYFLINSLLLNTLFLGGGLDAPGDGLTDTAGDGLTDTPGDGLADTAGVGVAACLGIGTPISCMS
jgi:hypothetical protein